MEYVSNKNMFYEHLQVFHQLSDEQSFHCFNINFFSLVLALYYFYLPFHCQGHT